MYIMKIIDLKIYPLEIPLIEKFKIAFAESTAAHTIIIEVVTDSDIKGFGEAVPTSRITGETFGQALENLKYIKNILIGEDPLYIGRIEEKINGLLIGNTSIKAAINMALYDILGKASHKPIYKLLGAYRDKFETDITIGIKGVDETVESALKYVEKGFKVLKIKVGLNREDDVKKIKEVRDSIGYDVRIRLDANQAWTPKETVSIMHELERYEIELLEQPIPYWDIEGLKYIKEKIDTPVIADESIHTSRDAIRLIKEGAVDGVNIKLMKCGGISEAIKIARIIEAEGLKCMIGCMEETKLALTAAAHVVGATNNIVYIDLDGNLNMVDEPVNEGIRLVNGVIHIPSKEGLGVNLDLDKIERFKYSIDYSRFRPI